MSCSVLTFRILGRDQIWPSSQISRHDVTDIRFPTALAFRIWIREMVLEDVSHAPMTNSRASIDGLSISMDISCGKASAREGTQNSAWISRRASLCLQTSGFSPSTPPRPLLPSALSSGPLSLFSPLLRRCFPTDLPVFLVFLCTPSPARWAKGDRKSFRVVFSPLAHYRRDRWDLNPLPMVVVVERTWTLHGMGTRAWRRCSTAKWGSVSARLVQRSLEESRDQSHFSLILFIRTIL